MIRQVLRNGQVTLPKQVVDFFHLKERDLVEVDYDESGIRLRPVVVEEFSQAEYEKLAKKLDSLKRTKGKVYKTTAEVRRYLDRLKRA